MPAGHVVDHADPIRGPNRQPDARLVPAVTRFRAAKASTQAESAQDAESSRHICSISGRNREQKMWLRNRMQLKRFYHFPIESGGLRCQEPAMQLLHFLDPSWERQDGMDQDVVQTWVLHIETHKNKSWLFSFPGLCRSLARGAEHRCTPQPPPPSTNLGYARDNGPSGGPADGPCMAGNPKCN